MMQRLLVSVRGKNEALRAWKGGAKIIDVEYPASALGTPYPLNIDAVRRALPKAARVSTNIGEEQPVRSTACQAAVGVAVNPNQKPDNELPGSCDPSRAVRSIRAGKQARRD